ncbi:MAG: hypothetical protein AAB401_05415, partial [Acidobacteriota bacterium]
NEVPARVIKVRAPPRKRFFPLKPSSCDFSLNPTSRKTKMPRHCRHISDNIEARLSLLPYLFFDFFSAGLR